MNLCPICNLPTVGGCLDPFGHTERYRATAVAVQAEHVRVENEVRQRLQGTLAAQARGYVEPPKPSRPS